jgi:translation elongation factor EF-Tu-like GTPase
MNRELIMVIEDVFHIFGRGVIVLGQIQNEKIEVGQKVIVAPEFLPEFETEIISIEAFRKILKIAKKNDNVGLQLSCVEKNKVKKKMKIYSL